MRLLRLPMVIALTGLSKATIYRYEAKGLFPKRRRAGLNAVGWLEADITTWLEQLPYKYLTVAGQCENRFKALADPQSPAAGAR